MNLVWNYRVLKTDEGYSVFEVFYDDNEKPVGTTEKPILNFYCDTPEDVLCELEKMKEAFSIDVLDKKEINKDSKDA